MTGLYVASNPSSLTAQFSLTNNMSALSDTLTRLSTGLRINSGKDDPAGLIASSLLKAEITGTSAAISNTQRANSMIATADTALGQVANLLNDIKGLVVEAANEGAMSADQIKANQLQINASINSIDRIASTTTYAGNKLLDGSMGFTTSGVDNGTVSEVDSQQANFGTPNALADDVQVQELARKGTLIYNGTGVSQDTTLDITGSTGTKSFTFGAGSTNAQIAEAINMYSDSTGVQAHVEGVASRGSITLSSAGANNDIVITAKEAGFDAGNYTFRIVEGEQNKATVVNSPTSGGPGVVEISLQGSYESAYNGFAGLFDIEVNTGTASAASSVSITSGTTESAIFYDQASAAKAQSGSKVMQITNAGTGGKMSSLNGWTVKISDDANQIGKVDANSKVVYASAEAMGTAPAGTSVEEMVAQISNGDAASVTKVLEGALASGDSFTFSGGAAANELVLTYTENSTVQSMLDKINKNEGVKAMAAAGVDSSKKIPSVIDKTAGSYASSSSGASSRVTSSVTANEMLQILERDLGGLGLFDFAIKSGDTGAGLVSYMDAAVDYGDVNADNAIRFTGMDDGPVVRMTATKANGDKAINQALSVALRNPTTTDLANGLSTKVLEIKLATDSSGNVTTTAADIVKLFNSLSPEQTGGISAALVLPDGVDPNNRTWVTDECGNITEVENCDTGNYGKGLVAPTGTVGTCEVQENDLVLLGANQSLEKDSAVAYVKNGAAACTTPQFLSVSGAFTAGFTDGTDPVSVAFQAALGDSTWEGLSITFTTGTGVGATTPTAGFADGVMTITVDDAAATELADIMEVLNAEAEANGLGALTAVDATGNEIDVTTIATTATGITGTQQMLLKPTSGSSGTPGTTTSTIPGTGSQAVGSGTITDTAGTGAFELVLTTDNNVPLNIQIAFDSNATENSYANGVLTVNTSAWAGITANTAAADVATALGTLVQTAIADQWDNLLADTELGIDPSATATNITATVGGGANNWDPAGSRLAAAGLDALTITLADGASDTTVNGTPATGTLTVNDGTNDIDFTISTTTGVPLNIGISFTDEPTDTSPAVFDVTGNTLVINLNGLTTTAADNDSAAAAIQGYINDALADQGVWDSIVSALGLTGDAVETPAQVIVAYDTNNANNWDVATPLDSASLGPVNATLAGGSDGSSTSTPALYGSNASTGTVGIGASSDAVAADATGDVIQVANVDIAIGATGSAALNGVQIVLGTADSFVDGVLTVNTSALTFGNTTDSTTDTSLQEGVLDAIKDALASGTVYDDLVTWQAGNGVTVQEASAADLGAVVTVATTGTSNAAIAAGDVVGNVTLSGGANGPDPAESVKITTNDATSSLNGVSFSFTSIADEAGFNAETGELRVFLNDQTLSASGAQLESLVNDAVNGAIHSNWDQIRQFNNTVEDSVRVSVDLGDSITVSKLLNDIAASPDGGTMLKIPPTQAAGTTYPADATRGTSVTDPALLIKTKAQGMDQAGIQIVFEHDGKMAAFDGTGSTLDVSFTENTDGTRTLKIRANAGATNGAINAADLAKALQENGTFNDNFTVEVPIFNSDPTSDATGAMVAFNNGVISQTTTTGGYKIVTDKSGTITTSSGVGMTGNNDSNERLVLEATEYGSEHFVKVDVINGSFDTYCPLGLKMDELAGTDIVATVNGNKASGRGTNISVDTSDLSLSMDVANKIGGTAFDITGGGALFQLGSNVVSSQQIRLGIPSIMSTKLGGSSGYLYQLKSGGDADVTKGEMSRVLADAIINDAISSIANTRGYLGAVQKSTLEPNIAVLQDSLVALTEANSMIEDADFAEESSNLTRLQLLVQSGMNTLGIANQFPQYAASLVR